MVETARHCSPLFASCPMQKAPEPDSAIRAELGLLAVATTGRAECSRRLFSKLRKSQGSTRFSDLLAGIHLLARKGEPVGARLLAALLDYSTVADRLLPVLSGLTSARRYCLILQSDTRANNPFGRSWLGRLNALAALPPVAGSTPAVAGAEEPWDRLRCALVASIEELRSSVQPSDAARSIACGLLRLEVDALEERASRLAGIVDPFRVADIQRLLPILSDLDARIRDSRHFISRLESGELDEVFRHPQSRAVEVMEPGEFHQLLQAMGAAGSTSVLSEMMREREKNARPFPEIAAAVEALLRLGGCLQAAGLKNVCTDLLGATQLALCTAQEDGFEIPLTGQEAEAVTRVLDAVAAEEAENEAAGPDFVVKDGCLCGRSIGAVAKDERWPHDLPAHDIDLPDVDPDVDPDADPDAAEEAVEFGATEAKKLVLANMQTLSILLSLLRNPKVTAVPGLVAEVATRTRNPQVIATIANDRSLFTGFANRDVPLACLRNPSNVSVKVLRKFIHVKFVSKIDLKRMSQDRAGVRRELRREIDNYLISLT